MVEIKNIFNDKKNEEFFLKLMEKYATVANILEENNLKINKNINLPDLLLTHKLFQDEVIIKKLEELGEILFVLKKQSNKQVFEKILIELDYPKTFCYQTMNFLKVKAYKLHLSKTKSKIITEITELFNKYSKNELDNDLIKSFILKFDLIERNLGEEALKSYSNYLFNIDYKEMSKMYLFAKEELQKSLREEIKLNSEIKVISKDIDIIDVLNKISNNKNL